MSALQVTLTSARQTHELGAALGGLLGPGDLVVLTGELGAGKTTLTQGLAAGLGVRGPITSPTFVIARMHPSLVQGPMLVHVDAYRLGGRAELDDLDLDTDLASAVTVVEWGEGLAEGLGEDRLDVLIETDDNPDGPGAGDERGEFGADPARRSVTVRPTGPRWASPRARAELAASLQATP